MVSYSIRVLNISKQVKKPDVIIGSSVHPFAVMSAWWLARRYKARFIFEVRDLWPQTPVEMGTIKPNSIEARLLYGWEKFMYKKTERIVVLMPNASKYIGNLGINEEKITWIPNGVNLSYFDKNDDDWESDILKTIKKNGNLFKVIYAGAHGPANGLDVVIEAAEILEKEDKDIHFFMVGDGVDKKRLMQKAEEMGMTNITFLGEVEKLQIPMVLKSSDVLLHCLKKLNVFKYGISPNKLNDYMASSKPIIMSANTSNNIIKEANAGLTVEPENPQELAKAIIKIKKMVPEERKKFGENGRKYIEEYYNIKKLADKLESIL